MDFASPPGAPARKRAWPALVAAGALCVAAIPAAGQRLPPPPAPQAAPEPIEIAAPVGIPAGARTAATPLSNVYLLSREPASGAWRVAFREEATQPEYVTRNGGASASGAVMVNCDSREFQLERFSLFRRNNLQGEERIRLDRRTRWQTPGRDTLLWRVVELTCGGARSAAPRPVASTVPDAAGAALRPALPLPPPSRSSGQAAGAYWVQAGASDNPALARSLLDKLAAEAPEVGAAGRRVSEAVVGDRRVWRSLFGPYADRSAAAKACAGLTARGKACFVRNGG